MAEVIEALSACRSLANDLPQQTAAAQAVIDTTAQVRDQTVVVRPQTATKPGRRRRWTIGAVTLLLAGASLLSIILKRDARPASPPPLAVAPFSPQEAQQHQRAVGRLLGLAYHVEECTGDGVRADPHPESS